VTTATVCFKRKSYICVAKFGNLGANGVKGLKFLVENAIFGIADPDLPIHYATFMGLRLDPLADLFFLIGWLTHQNGWLTDLNG